MVNVDIMKENFDVAIPMVEVLDHGFVRLVDCMPRYIDKKEETADHAIAEAARCSYQRGTKTISDDKMLIRYLMRHNHTSPFEMIEFKFHMKMPIFIARQIVRHRMASINELSGRYSEMPEEYYIPKEVRGQSETNKQGSEGTIDDSSGRLFWHDLEVCDKRAFMSYQEFLNAGVAREQARMVLPLNVYTEWYWKIDLKNLLHFLDVRCDSHAQQEVQDYGNAILKLIYPIVPWTLEAWEDYSPYRGGMMLTKYEVDAIRSLMSETGSEAGVVAPDIEVENKLEQKEWMEKAKKLGFYTK